MRKAEPFYHTQAWKDCRKAYAESVGRLCEICYSKGIVEPGVIVHHKKHLTADNYNDPSIALDWSNLQLVCRKCHAEQHPDDGGKHRRRYKVDEFGRVIY